MKLTRNMKAISKLLLILLLLTATIIGAILSYLWVIGYYVSLGIRVPEKTTVSITNVTFNRQDTSYFNVTLLNPSYSPTDADITQIAASPKDGFLYNVHPNETYPQLPYKLPKAKEKTFKCAWDWANYTGETVKIIAFVADGSGPTFEAETPLVDLKIIDPRFNSTISVTYFNMTVQNSPTSDTYVNITTITVNAENVTPLVPQVLPSIHPNDSVPLMCSWNWTDHQGKNVTITVKTSQGYVEYYPEPPERRTLSSPVVLTITDVLFEVTNTTRFNVIVQYPEGSAQYVNITRIMHACMHWTNYQGQNITITVHTLQGYVADCSQSTPMLLTITDVLFNPIDTKHFIVTVQNPTGRNFTITTINAKIKDGDVLNITDVEPDLSFLLPPSTNITFMCSCEDWISYQGKDVTITIETSEGYTTSRTRKIPGA